MIVSAASAETRGSVHTLLTDARAAARSGQGRLVLLFGEAGIGKTTTAREAATIARREGMSVRWSACWSGGSTVAHAPWIALLSGLGDAGRAAIDVLVGSDATDGTAATAARAFAYATVVSALDHATTDRPALLVLDDLHWADEGTLQLLDVVAAHLPALAVLVIGTYRDTEIPLGSTLARFGGRADQLWLRGLDHVGVDALLASHLGNARAEQHGTEVLRLTAGNPFLVVQVARLLADDPSAKPGSVIAAGARDLLRQRLDALGEPDRALLAAAGVLGSPFRTVDLAALSDRTPGDVGDALDRVAALRIVARSAGTGSWTFTHDLFRLAALDGRRSAEIASLHRRAASTLQDSDAEPAVIAAHLLDAGPSGHDAAAWLVRAGERALAAMAWEEAAGHFARALGTLDPGDAPDLRADALAGLGRARLLVGDEARATEAFEQLAALARRLDSAPMLARAALCFSADLSGFEVRLFDQRQIDLLEQAASVLAGGSHLALRALVLARLSVALSLVAPDARRRELAETAVALARDGGEPAVLAAALAAHCDSIAGPAHVARRAIEASEIVALAEAAGDGPLELLGRRLRYVARLEQGDLAGVEEDTSAFARRAAIIGNPLYSWYVPLWRAQLALNHGDVEQTERLIAEATDIGRAAGSLNGPMLGVVLRLAVMWHRGDYAGAVDTVESLDVISPGLADYVSAIGSYSWAYTLADKRVQASALLDRAVALGLENQMPDAEWLSNMCNMVRAAAALDHAILRPAVELLEPYANLIAFEGIGAGLYGSIARIVAIGCSALRRHDDAVDHARRAITANRAFGGAVLADALRTLANCMDARGDPVGESRPVHDDADGAYAAVGQTHLLRRGQNDVDIKPRPSTASRLQRDGDVWHVTYAGTTTVVKHGKGIADLATLLARPGREVHVTELAQIPRDMFGGRGAEALDRRAITAYRERLHELAGEIDDADVAHDLARAERARVEYDTLVEHLASSAGLGGRARAAGPEPIERLRKAVTARIRDAIRRLDGVHPALGRHLDNAVHTGTYCSYRPETTTTWQISTARVAPTD